MRDDFPESAHKLVLFLEGERGLKHIDHQEFSSFGDKADVWVGEGVAVQVARDRQNWFVEIRPEKDSGPYWYDVALLREELTDRIGPDVLPFDYQVEYMLEHWADIKGLLVGSRAHEALPHMLQRRNDRAVRRYHIAN